MNFSFLKPTTKKLLIFLIIFIILCPFIFYDTGIRCITTPCGAGELGSIAMFIFSYNHHIYDGGIKYNLMILELITSYLLACIIIKFTKN